MRGITKDGEKRATLLALNVPGDEGPFQKFFQALPCKSVPEEGSIGLLLNRVLPR